MQLLGMVLRMVLMLCLVACVFSEQVPGMYYLQEDKDERLNVDLLKAQFEGLGINLIIANDDEDLIDDHMQVLINFYTYDKPKRSSIHVDISLPGRNSAWSSGLMVLGEMDDKLATILLARLIAQYGFVHDVLLQQQKQPSE